jgi:hypothetical protein
MNEPYQGSRRVRSGAAALAYHKQGAPWPTCACVHCRRARDREGEVFAAHVERLRARASAQPPPGKAGRR